MSNPLPPAVSEPGGGPSSVRDWGLSWIRTTVPVLWGFLLTFLATRSPELYAALDNPALLAAVVGVVTVVWYSLMRWVEPHLPAWLTRFVLGSNMPPSYGMVLEGTVESVVDVPRQHRAGGTV
jgi:hypothetical protein